MCKSCVMPKPTTSEPIGSAVAAQLLHIDRSTLTRWVKAKKITPVLVGSGKTGEMFFNPSDIEALNAPVSTSPEVVETGASFV